MNVARRRHAAYYLQVLSGCNDLYEEGGEGLKQGLARFDLEWKNIEAGQAGAFHRAESDAETKALCSQYANAGAHLLDLRQHSRDRIRWLNAALKIARSIKDRKAEGAHLGNLGVAYINVGEARKAMEYYEQHLVIARELDDRNGESMALANLGLAYKSGGDLRKALDYQAQALAINREIGDRRGAGSALYNIGQALYQLGECEQAVAAGEAALAIFEETEFPHLAVVREALVTWRAGDSE